MTLRQRTARTVVLAAALTLLPLTASAQAATPATPGAPSAVRSTAARSTAMTTTAPRSVHAAAPTGRYAAYERIVLRVGSRGPAVRVLQAALRIHLVDGVFGPQTKAGVIAYQTARKLRADGIVTSAVWRALSVDAAKPETFAALSRRLGGSLGVAYAPVGLHQTPRRLGTLSTGVAWSTIKVPLAIASVRQAGGHPSAETLRLMRAAITRSDNDAALSLWSRLGPAATAAARTQAVLRSGGDRTTVVPSQRSRAGFTPFGQSRWSLTEQARFAASLPCMTGTSTVLSLMGQVTPSQRWGVGSMSGALALKGGWGPGTDGRYLVRQLAVVRLPDGTRVGMSLAVRPGDGRFITGTSNLDALARWVEKNVRTGGSKAC
jgi:peptidoglycan hydrolase-like protein with peptidoglycan-binding domain